MSRPAPAPIDRDHQARLRLSICGAVQGVGFRPFVYRLANELGLNGWVSNSASGVVIELEGERRSLDSFLRRLSNEKPPRSFIQSLESSILDLIGLTGFQIRESSDAGQKTAVVLPDVATCDECLAEVFDPMNRRYQYPFTNCTNCGPRFTIIEALPYDRSSTTMKRFAMCDECRREYNEPLDRRFHAQPNACPRCGPHLDLWNERGETLAAHHQALLEAAAAIRRGAIVAVKGLGGFHLMIDARNDISVRRLRARKHREEKPFAVMFPGVSWMLAHSEMPDVERRLLVSPERPIVLLRRQSVHETVSFEVAPGNPYLGVMLPYTPLHHLLMAELGFPVVATSGNLSDEPICTDEQEALTRLRGIADFFLVHDRPIVRHVDDSVVRVMMGREMIVRRARGYAPLPASIDNRPMSEPVLAMGGHLKNAIGISVGNDVFVSQHIGDLETAEAFRAFTEVIDSFENLYEVHPKRVACDAHPDYLSTLFANRSGRQVLRVQHHYAHVLSCMADNQIDPPVLGIAWDGTGWGTDGTIWGGEFLRIPARETVCACSSCSESPAFQRIAHLRTFRLPGGDAAVREPRRTALGVLYEILGTEALYRADLAPVRAVSSEKRRLLQNMLQKGVNSPRTSSAGRLFDAVASIIGLRHLSAFEGQAAMELEFALEGCLTDKRYEFEIKTDLENPPHRTALIDWAPMIRQIIEDQLEGVEIPQISARFHNTLVEVIVAMAERAGEERVVMSGGCFQNKYLTEKAIGRLRAAGFRPYWHQRFPPNDGGIALGQIVAASNEAARERE